LGANEKHQGSLVRVTFVLFKYFPYGGLERDMLAVARACLQCGHEVAIYTAGWQGEKPAGLHIVELPVRARSNHGKSLDFVRRFREQAQETAGSVIVGFNKMPGLDIYYAADSCFAEKAYQKRSFLYRMLPRCQTYLDFERAVFGEHEKTQVLLISPFQQAAFQCYYQTPAARLHLLPPGIARDRINASGERAYALHDELGLDREQKIILMVGSGFRTKGLDRAIDAIAALPAQIKPLAHLVIAGDDDKEAFVRQAKQKGLEQQIHFLGGRNDIASLLQSADVLIHPAYREAAGKVLLEAAVACLPVIVTDVCGYAHYIAENDLGVVLPSPFAQEQLDSALQRSLTDTNKIREWRKNGKIFAETADIYSMPERFVEFIESMRKP
jgi:UDP-glucose:(heptosyl)LPS alpha-1,3-glucosyltransferase